MARKSSMRERARERAKSRKESQSFSSTTLKLPKGKEIEFYKPSKGVQRLDVLPYEVTDPKHTDKIATGELWHSRRYFMHRNVGADEQSYICPAKTWGERCPICDYAKVRREAGASKDELSSLRPKERQLFNVIDIKKDPDKILLWDVSTFLFGETLDEELIEGDDDWAGFAELEDGFTLKVRFAEESFANNTFYSTSRIDFEERDNYDEDVLDDVYALDDLLVKLSYEELEAIFHMEESGVSTSTDDDEEEQPKRTKRTNGASKRKPTTQVEEEDEEEEAQPRTRRKRAEPQDEEVEEKPTRSRKKPQPETDEEDDEPAPKRGGRKRAAPVEEEDDEEPTPSKRNTRSRRSTEDDEDEKPKRGGRRRQVVEEDDDD